VHGKRALILPCLGRTDKDMQNGIEQFVSCENSMGVVQMSKGVLQAPSKNLLSEAAIVCRLAKATLGKHFSTNWNLFENDYDAIRDAIKKIIPGFENYNERVRKPGGFYLPNAARQRNFKTQNNKAIFTVLPLPKLKLNEDEYLMMTVRSHDQFNTTVYGMNDRYRGIHNERRIVMMHEDDMQKAGLQKHDVVDITSNQNEVERTAEKFIVVPMPIAKRCVAAYFPEANELVPIDAVAHTSNTPASKSVAVKLRKRN
ncbi:MAG TPA: molybdopterin dinucleotide binding domain-containing protein, partial [Chitinophagaceae bacterium]|nr:molybdopterin dinucleotide binding domain-containing protein [Chitinophagaceae bacterium]